jgi:hypothetical protein
MANITTVQSSCISQESRSRNVHHSPVTTREKLCEWFADVEKKATRKVKHDCAMVDITDVLCDDVEHSKLQLIVNDKVLNYSDYHLFYTWQFSQRTNERVTNFFTNIFLDEGDHANIEILLNTAGVRMMSVSICEQVSVGKGKNALKHFHDIAMVFFWPIPSDTDTSKYTGCEILCIATTEKVGKSIVKGSSIPYFCGHSLSKFLMVSVQCFIFT